MGNKVKFGLKNVHYATFENVGGTIVYNEPVRIPGAVELSLEPRGDLTEFYADDMLYYSAENNQGYDGTLNIALIPESFAIDCLGEEKVNGVLIEKTTSKGRPFAVMFEFDGDKKATRHVLYNCTANRPTVAGATKTETTDPQTDEMTFVASPRETDYMVKTKTTEDTPNQDYENWYNAVYETTQDTTPLVIEDVYPTDNDTGVSTSTTVRWEFNKPINSQSVNNGNFFVIDTSSNDIVVGTLSRSGDLKTVTLTPSTSLSGSTTYNTYAKGDIKDTSGIALGTTSITLFTTE